MSSITGTATSTSAADRDNTHRDHPRRPAAGPARAWLDPGPATRLAGPAGAPPRGHPDPRGRSRCNVNGASRQSCGAGIRRPGGARAAREAITGPGAGTVGTHVIADTDLAAAGANLNRPVTARDHVPRREAQPAGRQGPGGGLADRRRMNRNRQLLRGRMNSHSVPHGARAACLPPSLLPAALAEHATPLGPPVTPRPPFAPPVSTTHEPARSRTRSLRSRRCRSRPRQCRRRHHARRHRLWARCSVGHGAPTSGGLQAGRMRAC